MNTKHTPGPWRLEKHPEWSQYYGNIVGSYGIGAGNIENIRTISVQLKHGTDEETEANARLIAAAPDLLAALQAAQELLEHIEEHGADQMRETMFAAETEAEIQAAIAAATA